MHRDEGAPLWRPVKASVRHGAFRDQSALTYAHNQESARQAAERAVTNREVIAMTQNNLSDDLIIKKIRMRGGWFDTSPDASIFLREQGVSEYLLLAMEQYGMTR